MTEGCQSKQTVAEVFVCRFCCFDASGTQHRPLNFQKGPQTPSFLLLLLFLSAPPPFTAAVPGCHHGGLRPNAVGLQFMFQALFTTIGQRGDCLPFATRSPCPLKLYPERGTANIGGCTSTVTLNLASPTGPCPHLYIKIGTPFFGGPGDTRCQPADDRVRMCEINRFTRTNRCGFQQRPGTQSQSPQHTASCQILKVASSERNASGRGYSATETEVNVPQSIPSSAAAAVGTRTPSTKSFA